MAQINNHLVYQVDFNNCIYYKIIYIYECFY